MLRCRYFHYYFKINSLVDLIQISRTTLIENVSIKVWNLSGPHYVCFQIVRGEGETWVDMINHHDTQEFQYSYKGNFVCKNFTSK